MAALAGPFHRVTISQARSVIIGLGGVIELVQGPKPLFLKPSPTLSASQGELALPVAERDQHSGLVNAAGAVLEIFGAG